MKNLALLTVVVVVVAPAVACAGWEVGFSDDFNRPDGPLGPPWFDAGTDTLYIQSGRVVGPPTGGPQYYGLSGYDHTETGPSIALEADFCFLGDEDGWFHFWIAGGGDPEDIVAYGAEIDRATLGLYFYPPESLIVETGFAFDPYTVYNMRLEYDHSTGIAKLVVRDVYGTAADSIWTYGPGTDFSTIRIGIEHMVFASKWIDNVVLWQKPWSGIPGRASQAGGIELYPPHPNPCCKQTVIGYSVPYATEVSISIYDTMGREVVAWDQAAEASGYHEKCWDGTARDGRRVSPGVYMCKVRAASQVQSRKLIVAR